MAVISQKFYHTPIAGGTGQLSIPDANKQREFADWVEAKEVRNTQFTDWMRERSEPFEQIDIEIGQSYAPFISTFTSAPVATGDTTIVVQTAGLLRPGDQLRLRELYSGSTTEYDDTRTERTTIITINTGTNTLTVDRAEGIAGPWLAHPTGTQVQVVSRAQNYNEPFPDAITFRGDSMKQHPQRFDSGEITYDLAAVKTPDFEAPNGHYMTDVMYWKNTLPYYRNDAFINGRRRTGDYLASPKIPYRLGGAVWFAEQLGSNVVPVNGLLNVFDFSDIYEDLETNHADGPGDTIWMHPRMFSIWNEMLLPYKGQFDSGNTTLDVRTTRVKAAFGTTSGIKWDTQWPASKILLCSKADFEWSHFQDMDWQYVERGPEELGAFQRSWTMGGDFSMVCNNLSHLRLLTGVDTRKDLYPGRTNFQ